MTLSNENKETNGSSRATEIQAADEYGIDISMLKDNLKLSPAERIRRHQIALNTAEKLREATHE